MIKDHKGNPYDRLTRTFDIFKIIKNKADSF